MKTTEQNAYSDDIGQKRNISNVLIEKKVLWSTRRFAQVSEVFFGIVELIKQPEMSKPCEIYGFEK